MSEETEVINNEQLIEAYDALTSGMLDTADIEPYMHTITEALQIAGIKMSYLEQEQMVGKMIMASAIKVRLDMNLPKADIVKFIEDFVSEYKEWFEKNIVGVLKDG